MKIFRKYILLISVLLFTSVLVNGQAINGDTIYVDTQAEVAVLFPVMPNEAYTNPLDAPYNFLTFNTGFTIRAKVKNSKAVPWVVVEGKRTHHFWIAYKRINYNNPEELEYDYSSTRKLEDHIKQQEAKRAAALKEEPEESKPVSKKDKKNKTESKDNASFKYYSLLESGDQKLKKQQYVEAKVDFEKAVAMKPDEIYPKQKLQEVNARLSDKAKKDNQKVQEAYKDYISDGDKALKKNKLTEARTAYEQALMIVPNDKIASSRISEIDTKEKQLKDQDDLEDNYNKMVASADKAFQDGDYSNAKLLYIKALNISKKPWPQEQIDQVNKLVTDKAAKEASDKQLKAQKAEDDRKDKELQSTKKKYYAALQSADRLFADNDLAKAKKAYNKALEIMDEPWPKEQIRKIDNMVAEQGQRDLNAKKEKDEKQKLAIKLENEKRERAAKELEDRYNNSIQSADHSFAAGDYETAKAAYRAAIAIIKKPWPEEQIKKIDKLVAEQAAREKAEKIRLEQEKAILAKYTAAINAGDKEFGKNNYLKAKQLYLDAVSIKPAEVYPKQKLNEIQATMDRIATEEKARKEKLAAEAELKKKFDIALSKAKFYLLKEDLENALASYTEASKLKPNETEPQNQVKTISAKLAEIAKQKEINEKYEAKITVADSLLIAKNYDPAIVNYEAALKLKPSETYPNSQIKFIQAELKDGLREKEENDKREAIRLENEKEIRFRELIVQADKSVTENNFERAKKQYGQALELKPDHEYAKRRYKIASDQLEKAKKDAKDNKDIAGNEPSKKNKNKNKAAADDSKTTPALPQKQTNSPYEFQVDPLPYSAEELKAKYPDIDFTALPPEQPFNEDAVDSKENIKMFNEVLADKPRLDISDKVHKVKVICQGISFLDKAVYIKLLIQNSSDKDFLTGAMMFTWTRRLGNHIKLYPLYIYPSILPVIKPNSESVVIYVCKSYNIADDEKLKFELSDRTNKIKFELNFRGSVYNEESVR